MNSDLPILDLPQCKLKYKSTEGSRQIFDTVRKKYVALTPEEWVRQHFLHYLMSEKKVPASLIVVEKKLHYNKLVKRSDIVVFSNDGQPLLLVECKAPDVGLSQRAFDQAAMYNMDLLVRYLAVTNGMAHYYCIMDYDDRNYTFIPDLPSYKDM